MITVDEAVEQLVQARAEIIRLRETLVEISATFNKPAHLQGNSPAMIAYAALKTQHKEG